MGRPACPCTSRGSTPSCSSSTWPCLSSREASSQALSHSKVPHKAQSILVGHPLQPYHCSSNTYLCQLLDTLPVCLDFKMGRCSRPLCDKVHILHDYVEVTDGRVAVCRDAVRGKCSRPMCKYYHIPVTLPPSKWRGNTGQYHTPSNGSLLGNTTLHNTYL